MVALYWAPTTRNNRIPGRSTTVPAADDRPGVPSLPFLDRRETRKPSLPPPLATTIADPIDLCELDVGGVTAGPKGDCFKCEVVELNARSGVAA